MVGLTEQIYRLPTATAARQLIDWHLDVRGLEWTEPGTGRDRWMPFACMRRISIGETGRWGSVIRISGPPGAISISREPNTDGSQFFAFAEAVIAGACGSQARVRFQVNHRGFRFGWLWARTGNAEPLDRSVLTRHLSPQ